MTPNLITQQIFGDFIENISQNGEYLIISFSPTSIPLQKRWRNNGLSADFLADYVTTFFPGDENDPISCEKHRELKSAISYIANELLENAMKFSDEKSQSSIGIELHLRSNNIILMISNSINPEQIEKFQEYIKELITANLDELYVGKLEKMVEDGDNYCSGLGLLTIINDYGAKLAWKFTPIPDEINGIYLTTMVQLSV